jgi:hypothetical protein
VTDRTLQGMARVRCNPAAAATIDLRLIVTASAVQLDPAHEADARFFESDRGCWKAGLRSAGLTNACSRRPSAPLRKVIESPAQCGGQAGCRVFLRHISIMRLLSLGYEPTDVRFRCLGQSLVTALTSADLRREVVPGLLHLCRISVSRCVRFTSRFTERILDLWLSEIPRARTRAFRPVGSPVTVGGTHVERVRTGGFTDDDRCDEVISVTCGDAPGLGRQPCFHPTYVPRGGTKSEWAEGLRDLRILSASVAQAHPMPRLDFAL